jgi:hypothetical protein
MISSFPIFEGLGAEQVTKGKVKAKTKLLKFHRKSLRSIVCCFSCLQGKHQFIWLPCHTNLPDNNFKFYPMFTKVDLDKKYFFFFII